MGRPYTLFEEASLRNVMDDLSGENLKNVRISDDLQNSGFRQWHNAVVKKNECGDRMFLMDFMANWAQ